MSSYRGHLSDLPPSDREDIESFKPGYHEPVTLDRSAWVVTYDPPPIPVRSMDWQWLHVDYEPGDSRHGRCACEAECWDEIADWLTDNE